MSIISAVKTYIKTNSSLTTASVWVNFLGDDPAQYSIVPLPGNRIVEAYIDGSSLREFPFAFRSVRFTSDEAGRIEAQAFFETFADWLESQTEKGTLPTLSTGQTAESIEATGWGYILEQGESETGIYHIQCRLQYEQEK